MVGAGALGGTGGPPVAFGGSPNAFARSATSLPWSGQKPSEERLQRPVALSGLPGTAESNHSGERARPECW